MRRSPKASLGKARKRLLAYGVESGPSLNDVADAAATLSEQKLPQSRARKHNMIIRWMIDTPPSEHENNKAHKEPLPKRINPIGSPHPDYKRDEAFYRSDIWKELRYMALKNTDGRCQCCGARASDGVVLHVDHVEPIYKRPDLKLSLSNLQVLCGDCNIGKGAWDNTDWRQHFKSI